MSNIKRRHHIGILLLVLMPSLSSCYPPIPVLGGVRQNSRANLESASGDWIVVGRTTRREVLMRLGEPDAGGGSERQDSYVYESVIGRGGVAILNPAMEWEKVEYRRLFIRFDAHGLVSSSRYEAKKCHEWESNVKAADTYENRTSSCLDLD